MIAYLWDQQGRPVSVVQADEPAPPSITIPTINPRFERIFWRIQGRTMLTSGLYSMQAFDYEEGPDSPRRTEKGICTP
jgi:hypothetical protein